MLNKNNTHYCGIRRSRVAAPWKDTIIWPWSSACCGCAGRCWSDSSCRSGCTWKWWLQVDWACWSFLRLALSSSDKQWGPQTCCHTQLCYDNVTHTYYSHTHTHTHTLAHTHIHTHTLTHSLSHAHTHTRTHTHPHTHMHTHTHIYTHTHTHTHTLTHTHTHTHIVEKQESDVKWFVKDTDVIVRRDESGPYCWTVFWFGFHKSL